MAEATETGATPAESGATPNTPEAPTTPESTAATTDDTELGPQGLEALKKERELREAAEKRERDLGKKLKAYEDKDKSESEKATERIAALEKELASERTARQEGSVRLATAQAARKLGFRDPDIAHRLVSMTEVEFDDAGHPKNIERLLDGLAKAHPYLVNGTSDAGLGPRGSAAPSGPDMNAMIRRAAGRPT